MPLERRTPLSQGTKGLRRTPLSSGTKGLSSGTPLARKAPMPRASAAPARAQPARTTTPARAQKPRTPTRRTGTTQEVRALVNARDGGLCVRCGAPATDQDHRRGRGMGGTKGEESDRINGAAWILTLCGHGNAAGFCHGWKEADEDGEPTRLGYKIPRNGIDFDAELLPVFTRAGWFLFTNDGKRRPVPDPPGQDARNAY